jgi:thiol-disulfide isomerase/thioredoxin
MCAATALMAGGCDRGSHPSEIGKPAPDFTVADGTSSIHLASYRGQIVLLNFWASWCEPCILELPSLKEFHREHPEYPILAVSIDESQEAYKQFLVRRNVNFNGLGSAADGFDQIRDNGLAGDVCDRSPGEDPAAIHRADGLDRSGNSALSQDALNFAASRNLV